MKRAMGMWGVLLVAGMVWAGCPNGNGPGPVEPNGGTEPGDAGAIEPEDVETPLPPPPPQEYVGTPGTLKVTATFNGAAVAATIEVRRTGETEVRETRTLSGDQAAEFSLPPGRYDVRAVYPGAIDAAADVREGQRIESGATRRVDFAFDSISQVTIECKKGGRNVNGTIRLRRPGGTEYPFEARCQEEFIISGGAWEAQVTLGTGRGAMSVEAPLTIVGGGVVHTPIMIEGGRGH